MRGIIAFLVASVATIAAAQPSITGDSGSSFAQGESWTITGTFGANSNATPIVYDLITNQSGYDAHNLSHGDEVPVVTDGDCATCPWYDHGAYGVRPAYYDSTHSRVASRPAYRIWRKGYFKSADPMATLSESATTYVSWWYRSNHDLYTPPGGTVFNKLTRYTAGDGSPQWENQIEVEAQAVYASTNGACRSAGWEWVDNYTEWYANEWHHIEIMVVGGGDMANGSASMQVLRDGILMASDASLYSCDGMLDFMILGSDPNTPELYPVDSEILFGELYFNDSPARVLLSGASDNTWPDAGGAHWEIQPVTSWSNGSITFDLDFGSLNTGGDIYAYVVNESGELSSSHLLGSGGSGTPDIQSATRSGGNAELTWNSGDGGPYMVWLQASGQDVCALATTDTTATLPMSSAATDVTVKDGTSQRKTSIPE